MSLICEILLKIWQCCTCFESTSRRPKKNSLSSHFKRRSDQTSSKRNLCRLGGNDLARAIAACRPLRCVVRAKTRQRTVGPPIFRRQCRQHRNRSWTEFRLFPSISHIFAEKNVIRSPKLVFRLAAHELPSFFRETGQGNTALCVSQLSPSGIVWFFLNIFKT